MRLFDHFDWHARERPDAVFSWFAGREIRYGEALARANQIANALIGSSIGLGPGRKYQPPLFVPKIEPTK